MHNILLGPFILKEDVNVCCVCVCDSLNGKRNLKQKEFEGIMQNNCPCGLVNGVGRLKVILAFFAILMQHTTKCIFHVFPSRNGQ